MIRACPACNKSNRVPASHLAQQGKCGACKAALPPVAEPIEADAREFDDIVASAKVPVLVDFWAAWCAPCRAAAPHVKQVAQEMSGRALVLKVNSDENGTLAERYGVRGIPNFLVLHGGKPVMQQAGLVDARTMKGWLERAGA
jgi:thioredoxin 2